MIPNLVRADILDRLKNAEAEHNVKVLLAVESGSRAWGFASPNSDYDARFIYVNQPEWYLSVGLEEQRDVIEYPIVDEIDINGWDLRKALRLYRKSNPAFVEWIQSPIVYSQTGVFAQSARDLMGKVYSCERGIYHYRSMAKTNYRGYLRADQVPLKKYFYVLRPLLSVRWLERFGNAAPIEFNKLLAVIADKPLLIESIHHLLELKRHSPEMGLSRQIPPIHAYIEEELARLETMLPEPAEKHETVSELSLLFCQVRHEAWG